MKFKRLKWLLVPGLFIGLFFSRFCLSLTKFNRDFFNHLNWVKSILKHGFRGFYQRNFSPWAQANYPPLANILFWISHKFYLIFGLSANNTKLLATFYKLPVLVADLLITLFIYRLVEGSRKRRLLISGLFFFNFALIYNSVFWGQLESLVGLFSLLALFYFFNPPRIFAFLACTLALLTKQSALVFLPVFLVLLFKRTTFKKGLVGVLVSLLLFISVFSFFLEKNFLTFPWRFYLQILQGQVHQHWASVNAFNFWFVLGLNKLADSGHFLGLTYRFWGFLLVALFNLPLFYFLWQKPEKKRAFYITGLLFFSSFLFLTRMHERHLYPVLLFLLPGLNSLKSLFAYLLLSFVYFLNMHLVWAEQLANPTAKVVFIGQGLSSLALFVFFYYYQRFFVKILTNK